MPRTGRPTKLTEELAKKVIALVEDGDRPETACGANDIDRVTYWRWMGKARQGIEPFASFATDVACARDRFKSEARRIIRQGDEAGVGFGPAKATLEILSRQFPKEWAPKVSVVLEEAETIWFDVLQTVCADPNVLERVRQEQDLGAVLVAVCERIASLDSAEEAASDTGERADSLH